MMNQTVVIFIYIEIKELIYGSLLKTIFNKLWWMYRSRVLYSSRLLIYFTVGHFKFDLVDYSIKSKN